MQFLICVQVCFIPRLDLVLERSMIVCLLGLFRTERLASEMSAVTLVMDILEQTTNKHDMLPITARVCFDISSINNSHRTLPSILTVSLIT